MGAFGVMLGATTKNAFAATNQQMNFQGRLLNAQGAVVPDGYYNIQFKIYEGGTGTAVGNPTGTLKWTENWLNSSSQGVQVINGYMSVQLGSINPFGAQIDWNSDTLWLSMNIGNTNTTCTPFTSCVPDGEMIPMKRLSAVAYAMNATMLGGRTEAGFIQNTTTLQSANIAVQSANSANVAAVIQGASGQTADLLQLRSANSGTSVVTVDASGAVSLQPATDSANLLAVKTTSGLSVLNVNSSTSQVSIGNASTVGDALVVTGSISATTAIKASDSTLTGSSLIFGISAPSQIQAGNNQPLSVQGGNATTVNTNGGNLALSGGTGNGSGVNGLVVMTTPTFQTTTNDANCFTGGSLVSASCTISAASVNGSSAIIVGFSTSGQTAILPDPTILTAGRVVYVTASTTSQDFTLSVNGGGQGNQIAMRKNTTATMIWNGADWTAAGASSSTTLQAAYDNTLQSAGGAELVVSKTSATNGITIRDSATNSVNGTLLSVQTASAAGLFQVNGNVTEYASDAGAEVYGASTSTFPANTWTGMGSAVVSRYTTAGNFIATGQASVATTSSAAGDGVKNILTSALTPNMTYNVSFTTRLMSGTFTDMGVYYSIDGTTNNVTCATAQTSATSIWKKVNCTFTAPASGITASNAIIIRQGSAAARTFYVDNISVTIAADFNLSSDGSVVDPVNFATNWSAVAGATVTRTTTAGNDASDSAQVVTTATAGQGVRNKLSINPLANTLYRVTAYAASSTAFTDFTIRYSRDGGTNFTACADYNTQTISTSPTSFTMVTCYITTDGTAATNPYLYFTQTAGSARTFYVDTVSMTLNSNSTPNVQIGGGTNGGPTTLFTLDRGASAPVAANNDALLGSMYYDTTLGKLQCYEADGWGACGSSPDSIVTISPEFTNAVLHGTGVGTMTSDLCSSTLSINDGSNGQPTICGSGETYNFYKWTSPQASAQTYSIYVTYQLPSNFKGFNSGQTSLMGRTDNGTNGGSATVQYQIYRNTGTGLSACGLMTTVSTGTVTSWQTKTATGAADPSTCNFAPGNSVVFKIDVITSKNANAYVGNLNFSFNNR
ncbi:MAG: carbohydrate binding domain-containing protein [Candidatus Saccharimonas sp.]